MTMQWVRENYNVPVKRGAHVLFLGEPGVVVGMSGPHLRVKMKSGRYAGEIVTVHPTWEMQYPVGAQ